MNYILGIFKCGNCTEVFVSHGILSCNTCESVCSLLQKFMEQFDGMMASLSATLTREHRIAGLNFRNVHFMSIKGL
jgi:epoxyqueuosine reductase QueG